MFFPQCADRFHNADRMTLSVPSCPSSTFSSAEDDDSDSTDADALRPFLATSMADSTSTGTTPDELRTSLLAEHGFQARLRKRWAVALRRASSSSSWWTITPTKGEEEQRKLLMLLLPNVRLVRATTA